MSSYLARLKQLESEKKLLYAPNTEPPKPPKAPFDPFAGSLRPVNVKKYLNDGVANSGGKVAKVAKIARVNLQTDPTAEPTKAEKLLELDSLIQYVAANNGFSDEDTIEAKSNAENDLENALLSFRALARAVRQVKVLALLEADPGLQRAIYADTSSNQHDVILAIAVFGYATCEVRISKARYNPFRLLDLIEKHGNQTH